jgi:hypothetical protein
MQIRIVLAASALLGLAACSSSGVASGGGQPAAPAGGGATSAAGGAVTNLPGLGPGGPLDVSKLCAAVPNADVQKLFKGPVPAVTANPGECDWGGGDVTVDVFSDDPSKQYYNGGAVTNGTPISGVGDVAQWAQPVPGATVPFLAAHKGSLTITISPGLDVADTTMTYTGKSPFYKIPAAAALQFATEEGQICNDMFAASK